MGKEKSPPDGLKPITRYLLIAGIGLHLATAVWLGQGSPLFRAGLAAWSCAPYLLLMLGMRRHTRCLGTSVGALVILFLDADTFWSVFIAPRHSTAALGLLATPFWNLLVVTPLAIGADWLLARRGLS